MNLMKHTINKTLIALLIGLSFVGPSLPVKAATTPSLGSLSNAAILANAFVSNSDANLLTGNAMYNTLGGSGSHTVTGSNISPISEGTMSDFTSLLGNLNAQACDFTYDAALTGGTKVLSGTLPAGVHCVVNGGAELGAGESSLSLNETGTYIFRVEGTLSAPNNTSVTLSGAADACHVFWTPGGATNLFGGNTFNGSIVSSATIHSGSGNTINGRLLAATSTVDIGVTSVQVPSTCNGVVTPRRKSSIVFPELPKVAVTVKGQPSALTVPGNVVYTYTVTNPGVSALRDVRVADTACSTVTYVSGDYGDHELQPGEQWMYTCSVLETKTVTHAIVVTGYSGYDMATANTSLTTTVATPAEMVVTTSDTDETPTGRVMISLTANPARLPAGGGYVVYTYMVSNAGNQPLHSVQLKDDVCTDVRAFSVGDTNHNAQLDAGEQWVYKCRVFINKTTTNHVTVTADYE